MDRITIAKEQTQASMEMFLRNFRHVPDDRLTWTPVPSAKSALRIAAHSALHTQVFAQIIRERKLPRPENLQAWLAEREAQELALTDRLEIEHEFKDGTRQILASLDQLTPEDLRLSLDSGQGWAMPMTQVITLPDMHAHLHCGQIDYLQTCWGDQNVYVG